MAYVICPEKITSPAPGYAWMPPNMRCGVKCEVVNEGPVMEFHCARGHQFWATPVEVKRDA